MSKIQKGREGENLAIRYLESEGYRILEKNFRNSQGEIDIIAQKETTIYFIEVKNWERNNFPLEVFTQRKVRKMRSLAEFYFYKMNLNESNYYVSFGLISIKKEKVEFFFDLF